MPRTSQQLEAVPEPIARETTEPETVTAVVTDAPGDPLKDTAEHISRLQVLLGAAAVIFVAGVSGMAFMTKLTADLAHKSDVDAVGAKQTALGQRIDATDGRLSEHIARHEGDVSWIKDAIGRILDDRRIPRPPETTTIGPAR